jgi:hypothetical protein
MGVSPSHVPEMHAWLVKERKKLVDELQFALDQARKALCACLRGSVKELEPKSEESQFDSDRIGSRGPLPARIPTGIELLKGFRERHQELLHRLSAIEGLDIAAEPVVMDTKRFLGEFHP